MSRLDKVLAQVRAGNHEEALAGFESLVRDEETKAEALGHRAWLFRSMGRFDEALRDYESLLEIHPNDSTAAVLRAQTLLDLGHIGDALTAGVSALSENPRSSDALKLIQRCQAALGETGPLAPEPPSPDSVPPWEPVNFVIDQLEKSPLSYPTSSFPEVGRFLYSFTRMFRPRLVAETGCYIGYSSLCIAQALEDNGGGHLHSFDLFLDKEDYVSPIIGPCSNALRVTTSHLEKAGLSERATFHMGDSSAMIEREFGDGEARFDMAFIDGDHTLKGCLRDWKVIDRLLEEGGVILLHDTMPKECGWMGPRYLLESLGRDVEGDYHWVNIPTPEGYGMGIVQKKRAAGDHSWKPTFSSLLTEWLMLRSVWGGKG